MKICVWFLILWPFDDFRAKHDERQPQQTTNNNNNSFFFVYAKYILMPIQVCASAVQTVEYTYAHSTPSITIFHSIPHQTKTETPFGHNSWLDAFNWWYSREDETVGFYRFELKQMVDGTCFSHRPADAEHIMHLYVRHSALAATEVFNNMFLSFTLTNFILWFFIWRNRVCVNENGRHRQDWVKSVCLCMGLYVVWKHISLRLGKRRKFNARIA